MDWGDLALAALAVLLVFLGAALTIGIEIARGQLERKQRRRDRRDDFQRETLLQVRAELERLARIAGAVWEADHEAYRRMETPDWGKLTLSDERIQKAIQFRDADFALDGLRECVFDEQFRSDVREVQRFAQYVVFNPTSEHPPGSSKDAFGEMIAAHKKAVGRFGELIRAL